MKEKEEKACYKCVHYHGDTYTIGCNYKCDFNHSGFKKKRERKKKNKESKKDIFEY